MHKLHVQMHNNLCFVLLLELKAAPRDGTVEQLTTPLRTKLFDETHSTNRPKALVSPMVKKDETTSSGWDKTASKMFVLHVGS